jgi:predicted phage gp36 major capsid-like protein
LNQILAQREVDEINDLKESVRTKEEELEKERRRTESLLVACELELEEARADNVNLMSTVDRLEAVVEQMNRVFMGKMKEIEEEEKKKK